MKTILVTTSWLDNEHYLKRTIRFVNYYSAIKDRMNIDKILIIDNASSESSITLLQNNVAIPPEILTHTEHFGRPSHLDYKYLWRAAYYHKHLFAQGYEKIIYADSDFYILSDKMVDFVNKSTGWVSPWCPLHNFPETGLQIITDCKEYQDFVKDIKPGEYPHNGQCMERVLPLTHVEKNLIGNRYTETPNFQQVPQMDFYAQNFRDDVQVLFGVK